MSSDIFMLNSTFFPVYSSSSIFLGYFYPPSLWLLRWICWNHWILPHCVVEFGGWLEHFITTIYQGEGNITRSWADHRCSISWDEQNFLIATQFRMAIQMIYGHRYPIKNAGDQENDHSDHIEALNICNRHHCVQRICSIGKDMGSCLGTCKYSIVILNLGQAVFRTGSEKENLFHAEYTGFNTWGCVCLCMQAWIHYIGITLMNGSEYMYV